MKNWKTTLLAAVATIASFVAVPSFAQQPATVHGLVTEAIGVPMTSGEVRFTKDQSSPAKDRKYLYTFPLDSTGNYKATGIEPGDYVVVVFEGNISVDFLDLTVKAGEDKTLNFDMTRAEYMKALTPEARKQIEDYKAKSADSNKAVADLNATLKSVRADLDAAAKMHPDVSKDVDTMQTAVKLNPQEPVLWFTLGDTLAAQAEFIAKADHNAGKPRMSDDAYIQEYSDAADAYKKSADLCGAAKKPNLTLQGISYNQMGGSLAKMGKVPDAIAAYDNAAKVNPPKAGTYFGNEAVVLYNNQQTGPALDAANKAIAADPTSPEPYFIKGQSLLVNVTLDPKTQKPVAPPDCIPAYQKFLSLTTNPGGTDAQTARAILTEFGQKVDNPSKK